MFEVGEYRRITYKNKDYTKTVHCKIVKTDEYCISVIDKFKNPIIIGRGSIIESSLISQSEVE